MPQPTAPRYQDRSCWSEGNLAASRAWFAAGGDSREQWRRMTTLSRDNRAHLHAAFGPPHQRWTREYRFNVWRIEHGGLVFWVLSHKSKGTCIEIQHDTPPWDGWPDEDERIVVSFLERLYAELHTREPPWEPPAEASPDTDQPPGTKPEGSIPGDQP